MDNRTRSIYPAPMVLRLFKRILTLVGRFLSGEMLHALQMTVNYLKLGWWMHRQGFAVPLRVRDRRAVFEFVAKMVAGEPCLYLEFGVFEGASITFWSQALLHPSSQLHGFDSFEGLPSDWDLNDPHQKGTFNVSGKAPTVPDSRVRFFKGWFSDTLPLYSPPDHERLIVVIDADLYSSTKTVLDHLAPWFRVGSYLYFDDMSRPDHEPRAFQEMLEATGHRFECIVADESLNCCFFRCSALGSSLATVGAGQSIDREQPKELSH